jgi:hypothetical protein
MSGSRCTSYLVITKLWTREDDGGGGMGVKHDQLPLYTLQQVGLHEVILIKSFMGHL